MKNSQDIVITFEDTEGINTVMEVFFAERHERVVAPGYHDVVCFAFITDGKAVELNPKVDGGKRFMLDKSQVGHLIDVLSSFHKNMKEREK